MGTAATTGLARGLRGNRDASDLRKGDRIVVTVLTVRAYARITSVSVSGGTVIIRWTTETSGRTGSTSVASHVRFTVLPA